MKHLLITLIVVMSLSSCCSNSSNTISCTQATETKNELAFNNADFYTADGKFDEEKGKDAIIELMNYYDYPVTPKTREAIWVSDYGQGKFTELGLACISFVNNMEDGYMLQDLFLLPNQMLPEHWHEKPANYPAKMEGWLVRYGKSYIVGVGEDNLASFPEITVPSLHDNGVVTVKHVVPAEQNDFVPLTKVFSHHWQMAGPEGTIISEVANNHSGADVRHQVKSLNDYFLSNL